MGVFSRKHIPTSPFPPVLSRSNSIMTFEYRDSGPGHRPAEIYQYHCLVIPVQTEAIRIITTQNGEARRLTLHQNDIALAWAGTDAAWTWLDPARVILIWIDPDAFDAFLEIELRLLLPDRDQIAERIITDPDLRGAAERIRQAVENAGIGSDIIFDALARVFLVLFARRHLGNTQLRSRSMPEFGVGEYTRIVDYIEAHLDTKITPSELAKLVGMSEAVFSRKFKLKVGKSPMRFVKEVRLEAATKHVLGGVMGFSEIAVACGFSDQAHFSRSFKAHHGVSPKQFRRSRT